MARRLPQPWLKTRPNGKKEYYVTIRQKQIFLAEEGISEAELQRLLILALSESSVGRPGHEACFVAVANQYLDFVKSHQSANTYRLRSIYLGSFRDYLRKVGLETILCKDLIPNHVNRWLDTQPQWGDTVRKMGVCSVKVCLSWAFEEGILNEKYLVRLKGPAEHIRGQEVIMTPEQRQLLLDCCANDHQRDVLVALYNSGCRPGELASLVAEDVHLNRSPAIWVVRGKPTKFRPDGTRLVALSPTLAEITKRLLLKHPTGPLFRNKKGNPWSNRSISVFVWRANQKAIKRGHVLPPKVIAYAMRHNFATDLLAGGAADYDVAKLMGHSGTKMIHQVYSKHSVDKAARALEHLQSATPTELKVFREEKTA